MIESIVETKGPEVWAVGGGKGGTGKSFFSSSVALCLADAGKRVVLVDADLGGANLCLRDYMLEGEPCWSNSKIKCTGSLR